MNWFWHAVWICFVVIPVTILWIFCIFDVLFRRNDLIWWKRLLWFVVLLVPLIGALIYAATTPLFREAREHTDSSLHLLPTTRPGADLGQGRFIT